MSAAGSVLVAPQNTTTIQSEFGFKSSLLEKKTFDDL
jgi:hypothetical protein